jgi:hypothetical protein
VRTLVVAAHYTAMSKLYYFQAPSFSINAASESAPKLGSIFYSLTRLTGPLNESEKLDISPALVNETAQTDFRETTSKGFAGAVGLNANLVQGLAGSADIMYGFSRARKENYQCDTLETIEFEPTKDFIDASIDASPRVQGALRKALPGKKRVFMITGLKIATGLNTSVSTTTQHGPMLQVGFDATALGIPAGVGPEVELAKASARTISSGKSNDKVVFAYRVVRIKQKREVGAKWKHKDGGKYSLGDSESDDAETWEVEALDEEHVHEDYPDAVKIVIA